MTQCDLNIIIILFNSNKYLIDCIQSYINTGISLDANHIFINNGIEEIGSIYEPLKKLKFKFHQLPSNLGFAKANNIGAGLGNADYLCFLNPDTLITEDFFTPIIKFIKNNPQAGACAPMLTYENGEYQNSSGSRTGLFFEFLEAFFLIGIFRLFFRKKIEKLKSQYKPVKTGWLSAACLLIKRDIFHKVGGFSEDYFLNYEDIDLCRKIENAGYTNYYFPGYKCIHLDHKSFDSDFELLVYSRYESKLIYSKIHYSPILRFLTRVFHITGLIFRILTVKFLYNRNESKSRLKGYLKAIKLYSGILTRNSNN